MLLQIGAALGGPFGTLLVALLAIVVILVVARVVLSIAWRITMIAVAVVGVLWVLSAVGII